MKRHMVETDHLGWCVMSHPLRWLIAATVVYWVALAALTPAVARDEYPKLVVHWVQTCPDAAHPDTLKYCPI